MGKGDRKTKRGKISKGTFGVSRRKRPLKSSLSKNGASKSKQKSTSAKSSVQAAKKNVRAKAAPKTKVAEVEEVVQERFKIRSSGSK